MTILKNGQILDENFKFITGDLAIENEKILDISDISSCHGDVIDCTDCYVLPGYIDLHTHGCAGYDNMDISLEAMEKISEHMAYHGTTTYLPTIMTASQETYIAAVKNISEFVKSGKSAANIGGIYAEGPYFSKKYKGAQNPAYLRNPDINEFNELYEASDGLLKIMSLAPELEGSEEFIKEASKKVKIAMGHTDADYDEAMKAISAGATQMTHTFNTMRPFGHRSPNAIGAAMENDVILECIGDGFHVLPPVVKILFSMAEGRVAIISDSLRPTGLPDGIYESGGLKVKMADGILKLDDGTGTIAGSSVHMADCVKRVAGFGIGVEKAVKAASYIPAKAAGIEDITGSLAKGKRADILITDKELNIKHVIIRGKLYR